VSAESSDNLLRPPGGPRRYRWYLKPGPIVLACAALAVVGWFVYGRDGLWERHKLMQRYDLQAEQIVGLKQQKAELEQYLAALAAKQPAAMEKAARKYHMVAPGEMIYEVKVEQPRPTN
jgi:cell division protein FtsB